MNDPSAPSLDQPGETESPIRPSPSRDPSIVEGLKALHKLRAATEVGITKLNYVRAVAETKVIVDDAKIMGTDPLKHAMDAAMQASMDAVTLWRLYDGGPGLPPQVFHKLMETYRLPHIEGGIGPAKETALSAAWLVARQHLDRAIQLAK